MILVENIVRRGGMGGRCLILLTPKGIVELVLKADRFLMCKMTECDQLQAEIKEINAKFSYYEIGGKTFESYDSS